MKRGCPESALVLPSHRAPQEVALCGSLASTFALELTAVTMPLTLMDGHRQEWWLQSSTKDVLDTDPRPLAKLNSDEQR